MAMKESKDYKIDEAKHKAKAELATVRASIASLRAKEAELMKRVSGK